MGDQRQRLGYETLETNFISTWNHGFRHSWLFSLRHDRETTRDSFLFENLHTTVNNIYPSLYATVMIKRCKQRYARSVMRRLRWLD